MAESVPCTAAGDPLDEVASFEEAFRRDHPLVWWFTLVGPIVLTIALLALLGVVRGGSYVRALVATALVTFFFFGRFVILGGEQQTEADGRFFPAQTLAMMVLYMDAMAAAVIAFHAGILWKLPIVGRRIQALAEEGRNLAAGNPWVRRATFASITAFVLFPLASTGSIGGSLFGRLLGMGRVQTFFAVLLGSALGCGLMYFGASLIGRSLDRSNPVVMIGGIVFLVVLILSLTNRFRKMTAPPKAE